MRGAFGDTVRRYHERTTHRPGRYARGPGFLDWASQPEPFRAYAGAERLELPLAGPGLDAGWGELHRPGAAPARPLDRASLGAFLELALGITAWKEHGRSRWALRANPSSGNLHPTEGYVLVPDAAGVPSGLHHYLAHDHVLERRLVPSRAGGETLARLLLGGAFVLGLASIHWREAWKYGERAFRYCQHDVGHALGSARYAAAVLGWGARLLLPAGDDDVAAVLGLDRDSDFASLDAADREHPDALVVVGPPDGLDNVVRALAGDLDALVEAARDGAWRGRPNALSPSHVDWPAIVEAAAATTRPRNPVLPRGPRRPGPEGVAVPADPSSPDSDGAPRDDGRRAVSLIRARRSAVAMDGRTGLTSASFVSLLAGLRPRPGVPPWDVLPGVPRVHPALLVHRVEGLAPGLYLLERARGALEDLRASLRPSFAWKPPEGPLEGAPLLLLEEGDTRPFARFSSCHQEIAADGAFAVAMLADLDGLDDEPWLYRRLHWEAGLLGHALYLGAEAAGIRGTGIGCFFDDVVHETLGLASDRFRDLYHFTVGGAVDDPRLATHPGYDEAVRRRPSGVLSSTA